MLKELYRENHRKRYHKCRRSGYKVQEGIHYTLIVVKYHIFKLVYKVTSNIFKIAKKRREKKIEKKAILKDTGI